MTGKEIAEALRLGGIENYIFEARLLCEELCGSYSEDKEYSSEKITSAIEKRCSGYPLQYILGKWWFWDCEFFVDESCLIPRPDTESIVERAVKLLPKNAKFADLCTGSGCIAMSILNTLKNSYADAYELYDKTLDIARKNAIHNKVDSRFCGILGDVLSPALLGKKKYDAIISNPPYIRSSIVPTLNSDVLCEPHAALDGGEDGLIFYRAILDNFAQNLNDGGMFIFEIGYDQGDDISRLASERGMSCELFSDLGGNVRGAVIYP